MKKTTLIIITVFWVLALLIVKITADYLYYPIVRVALEIRSYYFAVNLIYDIFAILGVFLFGFWFLKPQRRYRIIIGFVVIAAVLFILAFWMFLPGLYLLPAAFYSGLMYLTANGYLNSTILGIISGFFLFFSLFQPSK